MDKIAQERSFFSKMRGKLSPIGGLMESLNPKFRELMERLREADTKVREHAQPIVPINKSVQTYAKRRDYLSAATNIAALHERARMIAEQLQNFNSSVNLEQYHVLLEQLSPEQKEKLFGYNPEAELKLANAFIADFIKQADYWFDPELANLENKDRGRAAKAIEKRMTVGFMKTLRNETIKMANETNRFTRFMLRVFGWLSWALSRRNIDQYTNIISKKFLPKFEAYHKLYLTYHKNVIAPLKAEQEKISAQQQQMEEAKSKALEDQSQQQRTMQQSEQIGQKHQQSETGTSLMDPEKLSEERLETLEKLRRTHEPKPALKFPLPVPGDLPTQRQLPKEEKERKLPPMVAHNEFVSKIEKYASINDDKAVLNEILKYSEALDEVDSDASLKLLAIAEGMLEDYKTAGVWDIFKKNPPKGPEEKQEQPQGQPQAPQGQPVREPKRPL